MLPLPRSHAAYWTEDKMKATFSVILEMVCFENVHVRKLLCIVLAQDRLQKFKPSRTTLASCPFFVFKGMWAG